MEKGFKILLAIFVCVLLCTLTGCKKNKHNLEKSRKRCCNVYY